MAKFRIGIQQDLVTIICYSEDHALMVRNTVPVELYEGIYGDIATRVYDYIDKYNGPPKDHVADLLHDYLHGDDKRRKETFQNTLLNIKENSENLNPQFAIDEAITFVKRQRLKGAVIEAAELLQDQEGQPDLEERIEQILMSAVNSRLESFDVGTFLGDAEKSLRYLDDNDEYMPTGIRDLDRYRVGPVRGGMWLFLAAAKRGKTWMLANIAKACFLARYRVLHITLEMSEQKVAKRYHQTLFAMANNRQEIDITRIKRDKKGHVLRLDPDTVKPRLSLDDPEIRAKLKKKIAAFGRRLDRIVIKEFPTGSLTVRQLESYLDSLEQASGFVPDLLILDYPDLMDIESGDRDQHRHKLSRLMINLRGLAGKRNFALAVVSQINRGGAEKKLATETSVAEDWSKIANADTVLVYNQTQAERDLKLARLYVAAAREDMDKFIVLVSQSYATGQFALDSAVLKKAKQYDRMVKDLAGDSYDDDDEDD